MTQQNAAAFTGPNQTRAFRGPLILIESSQRRGHQGRIVRNAIAAFLRDALMDRSDLFSEIISKVVVLGARSGEVHSACAHAFVAQDCCYTTRTQTSAETG